LITLAYPDIFIIVEDLWRVGFLALRVLLEFDFLLSTIRTGDVNPAMFDTFPLQRPEDEILMFLQLKPKKNYVLEVRTYDVRKQETDIEIQEIDI
jgi:hypothetical protein